MSTSRSKTGAPKHLEPQDDKEETNTTKKMFAHVSLMEKRRAENEGQESAQETSNCDRISYTEMNHL
jgi:hypothetical protein